MRIECQGVRLARVRPRQKGPGLPPSFFPYAKMQQATFPPCAPSPDCCKNLAREKHFSSFLLLSSLELRDTPVYEPEIRARLGTTAHFCKLVVLTAAERIWNYFNGVKDFYPKEMAILSHVCRICSTEVSLCLLVLADVASPKGPPFSN